MKCSVGQRLVGICFKYSSKMRELSYCGEIKWKENKNLMIIVLTL